MDIVSKVHSTEVSNTAWNVFQSMLSPLNAGFSILISDRTAGMVESKSSVIVIFTDFLENSAVLIYLPSPFSFSYAPVRSKDDMLSSILSTSALTLISHSSMSDGGAEILRI